MSGRVMAIGCHPDDIEFMMAGTLLLLGRAGWELHYMNVANGSCGTDNLPRDEIVRLRTAEARRAAAHAGAVFHPPLVDDLAVFYEPVTLHRLGAVVRRVAPDIILTHGPGEYMEDHGNVCRLAVTAAFCRGMLNFPTDPATEPITTPVALYHALPYGLRDAMDKAVAPDFYVDVDGVMDEKRRMLAMHETQKTWLDRSQGLDAYLNTMAQMCAQVGEMSGRFSHAEGWRRHLHLGLCAPGHDPLCAALGGLVAQAKRAPPQ